MAVEQNFTGFEIGDLGELMFAGSAPGGTLQTGTPRSGNYVLRQATSGSGFDIGYMPAGAIVGTSGTVSSGNHKRVSARVYFRITADLGNGQVRLFGLGGLAGTCTVVFGAQSNTFNQPGTKIGLRITTQSGDIGGSNPFPWGTVDLAVGPWYRLLLDVDLDVGGTTLLSASLRITEDSDNPAIDFTLSNSFNIGATDNVDKLGFGPGAIAGFFDKQITVEYDDLVYIATSDADAAGGAPTLPSATKVFAIVPPTGEALNQWNGTHADVDDYPLNSTDQMDSSVAGAEVAFTHPSALALSFASVQAIRLMVNAKVSGVGSGSVDYMLNGVAKNVTLGATYPGIAGIADPMGGVLFSALSASAFAATTFGIKKQNSTQDTIMTNIGLEVLAVEVGQERGTQIRGETQIKRGSVYDEQIADNAAIKRHKIEGLSDSPAPIFFPEAPEEPWIIPGPPGAEGKVSVIPVVPVFFPEDAPDEMPMRPSGSSSSSGGGGGDIKSDGSVPFAADQSMGTHKLTDVVDPTNPQDAATKAYVDAGGSGGGAGALVLLESHTASGSADLQFTTRNASGQSGATFQSDYDEYVIEFINILPTTNGAGFQGRVSTNGGSTFDSSANYSRAFSYSAANNTSGAGGIAGQSLWDMGGAQSNSSSSGGLCGSLRCFNPLNATMAKVLIGQLSWLHNALNWISVAFTFIWTATTAVDALQFFMDSGNIDSGTIRIYGVAK